MDRKMRLDEINSAGIVAAIRDHSPGIKDDAVIDLDLIGSGHSDGNENNPNSVVCFYRLPWGAEVADTNGDPVFEDYDMGDYEKLKTDCGV